MPYYYIIIAGGFPRPDTVSKRTGFRFHLPFRGCMQSAHFGPETAPAIEEFSSFEGANIGICDLYGDELIGDSDNSWNNQLL